MDKYLKAIKQNVCAICVDSTEKGNCTLAKHETCAVELYLPVIIDIVHSVDSEDISESHSKVKEQICHNCRAQDDKGNCYLHEDANCSLDRYFSLIVDTIKRVDKGLIT
jgi:hypothetical protein